MNVFNFTVFPVLETQRLILRELIPEDSEAVFRIRGDYQVTRYNSGAAYERVQQATDLIASIAQGYQSETELRWGITLKEEGVVIGMCGFNYWMRRDYRASVGYDLAHAYWGKGIMSEAMGAVVKFGFERMRLNRIEADADGRNGASRRVLEKVGFQVEGLQRQQFFEHGEFHDLVLFSLLRQDYEKSI